MISLRPARPDELDELSALCLRSKAVHGYAPAMLEAFRAELTLTPQDLIDDIVLVAERSGKLLGVAQVSVGEDGCYLEKLFVAPSLSGRRVGRVLLEEALDMARKSGAGEIIIEADPGAVGFYRRMGAIRDGYAPSGSVAGRQLPRLVLALDTVPPA